MGPAQIPEPPRAHPGLVPLHKRHRESGAAAAARDDDDDDDCIVQSVSGCVRVSDESALMMRNP